MDNIALCKLNKLAEEAEETIPSLISKAVDEGFHPFIYNDDLYIYKSGVYNIQTKKGMLAEIRHVIPPETLDKIPINAQKNAIELVFARAERIDSIPRHYDLLNVRNGIYDILNDVLLPHDPKYKMNYILQVNYNPEAKAEKFMIFIDKTFKGRQKLIANVQETSGYLISDCPPIKEFILLKGESNTAKSAYTQIAKNMYGWQYINSVTMKDLTNEYYLSTMCSKKLNICGESESTVLRDLTIIKQLTSPDDSMQVRKIRQDTKLITDKPKMVFACNHYPVLMSTVENLDAFFNRVHIIPFDNIVPKEEQIEGYADMLFREEGEGILLWMLEGYRRFLANGKKFTISKCIVKAQDEYRNSYRLPDLFVKEAIKFSPDKKVFTSELTEHLKEFCEYNDIKYRPEYLEAVRRILHTRGIANKKIRKGKKTKQGFDGIKLQEYEEDWTEGDSILDF
ncbi:MAG: hypothetical protein HFE49_07480 [Clostridia bacterium]|nr:hypothetical protein [Clostridia bacterium]